MSHKPVTVNTFMLKQNGHRNKIVLKIDEEYMITYQVKPVLLDVIKKLPARLNELSSEKIPVVALYDDCSVICIDDGNGKYEFAKGWNGKFCVKAFIDFCHAC